jgi:hypothetical protein
LKGTGRETTKMCSVMTVTPCWLGCRVKMSVYELKNEATIEERVNESGGPESNAG